MKLYLKPEYFQTIHYYFFSLGVFSLTTALMFTEYSIYTFIFVGFYVAHSAISWYMSWFMHRKMKLVYIIQRSSYIVNHMVLCSWQDWVPLASATSSGKATTL